MGSGSTVRPQQPSAGRLFLPTAHGPPGLELAAARWDDDWVDQRSAPANVGPGAGCGFLFLPVGTLPLLVGSAVLLGDGGARIANDAVFVLVALVALTTAVVTVVSLLTLLLVLIDDARTERLVVVIKALADRHRRREPRKRSRPR